MAKQSKITRSFYLPCDTLEHVAKYATLRGVSQNKAVNELLRRALFGTVPGVSAEDAIAKLRAPSFTEE